MPTKQELEQLSLTSLAVFCQQVSDTPEKYTETGAAEAARLKREWLALQKSPPVSLQEQEEVELKQEMVETEKVNALVKIEQPLRDVMQPEELHMAAIKFLRASSLQFPHGAFEQKL